MTDNVVNEIYPIVKEEAKEGFNDFITTHKEKQGPEHKQFFDMLEYSDFFLDLFAEGMVYGIYKKSTIDEKFIKKMSELKNV